MRGAARLRAPRRTRYPARAGGAARCAGPAHRGRSVQPRVARGRPVCPDAAGLALRHPGARPFRRRAAHALGRLYHAPGRARRLPAPRYRERHRTRTARRQAHRRHLGRHHSRQRRLLGAARTAGHLDRHRARGLRGRKPGRRRFPAREHVVPHPAHRRRQGAGGRRPRRRAQHPVLDRRGAGPQRRAVVRRGAPAQRDRPAAGPCRGRVRRSRTGTRHRLAARTPGAERRRRAPDRRLPGPRPLRFGRTAHPRHAGDGALFRRVGRHAAGTSYAVRQPHQPRLGPRLAQTILPQFQFRITGRRHRGRHRAVAVREPQLPARRGMALPARHHRRAVAGAGAARRAAVQRTVALERHHRAGPAPLHRWAQGGAATAKNEKRRPAGRRLPRPGSVPGKYRRRTRTAEPPAGGPDAGRLPARGDGQRRLAGPVAAHGGGRGAAAGARPAGAVAAGDGNPQRPPLRLSGRRAAGRAPHPGSAQPPLDRPRFHRRPGRAGRRRHRGRGTGSVARCTQQRRDARGAGRPGRHYAGRSQHQRRLDRLAANAGSGRTRHAAGRWRHAAVGGARTAGLPASGISARIRHTATGAATGPP